jgi:hypothetical protein
MAKLTYEEWKAKQKVSFAPGVKEDMEAFHGVTLDEILEDIFRKLYEEYLNEPTVH